MRQLNGWQKWIVTTWCCLASLFHLYTASVGVFIPLIQRSIHLSFLLPLAFLFFPANKNSPKDKIPFIDFCLALLSLIPTLYIFVNANRLSIRMEYVSPVSDVEVLLGILNIVLLIEAIRRTISPIMAGLILVFLSYIFLGHYLPGIFHCQDYTLARIIEMQYLLADPGIYGPILGISATFVAIFVIFAAFLQVSGVGKFFNDIATKIAGKSPGGPAKIATIGSGLFATISGASSANVYATGSFTIPLMKKMGYSKEFAGAVEAAASTGGMIMPPVMGATAFIIAEFTRTPYIIVCKYALLGAVLYYFTIYIMVHLEALKLGLGGIDSSELPTWGVIIKEVHLIMPIICLVYFLVKGYSAFTAAYWATIFSFVVSFFRKETMMTIKKVIQALENGAKNMVIIALACAGAGIVISVITSSGLGLGLSSLAFSLSRGNLFWGLVIIMITSIILGMGLPTTAAYIITVAIGGPALQRMGVEILVAHLFVFYFAILSEITPPVAINAYAAAAISGGDPIKTGIKAMGLAITGFLIPYIFIYNPAILLKGTFLEIVVYFFLTLIALIAFGIFNIGIDIFSKRKINNIYRLIFLMISIFLVYSIITFALNINIVILIIVSFSILMNFYRHRKYKGIESMRLS